MMKKFGVGSAILMLLLFGRGGMSVAASSSTPRGEIRVVDNHPLNWAWITWNVFEHLVEYDKDGVMVPRLATGWHWVDDRTLIMSLRKGVRFHNGEALDAEIVKLNWYENIRLKQPHLPGAYLNFKPGSRLEIIDPYTLRFVFPEPDGSALVKLSLLHIANRQFYRDLGWGEKHW
jgi:ABC-type transport system substrate-binding protein